MFSVGASPFNSARRQLYGGWTMDTLDGDAVARAAKLTDDAARWARVDALMPRAPDVYAASKWANLALKLAGDTATRNKAKAIREALKGYVRHKRLTDASWKRSYANALKHIRTDYRKPSLSGAQRDLLWRMFQNVPYGTITDPQRLFVSMLGSAPYTSRPRGPLPNFVEDYMVSGPYSTGVSKPAYEIGNAQLALPQGEMSWRPATESYYQGLVNP